MTDQIVLYTEELEDLQLLNIVKDIYNISIFDMYWDIVEDSDAFSEFVSEDKRIDAYYFSKIIEAVDTLKIALLDETCTINEYSMRIENYVCTLGDELIDNNRFREYLMRVAKDNDSGITELIRITNCKYYTYMSDIISLSKDIEYDKVKGYLGGPNF